MKIEKHGNLPPRVRFGCEVCGCEFVAEVGEYSVKIYPCNFGADAFCDCPECGRCAIKKIDDPRTEQFERM